MIVSPTSASASVPLWWWPLARSSWSGICQVLNSEHRAESRSLRIGVVYLWLAISLGWRRFGEHLHGGDWAMGTRIKGGVGGIAASTEVVRQPRDVAEEGERVGHDGDCEPGRVEGECWRGRGRGRWDVEDLLSAGFFRVAHTCHQSLVPGRGFESARKRVERCVVAPDVGRGTAWFGLARRPWSPSASAFSQASDDGSCS